ncbi:hypothetical protein [Streptomyces sp. NPDC059010]|uniref:hypothetical protein n=1 Tax=Streptomyces sp. NPDC059010 TaxID=3346695 RepID=UPI0036A9CD26
MVTAWSPWCVGGTRLGGRPLLRVLAMAALLFGVLMTQCGHMESADGQADGHLSSSATVSAAQPDDESSHSGEQCLPGQPQQGSVPAAPCFAAWVRQATGVEGASPPRPPAIGRSVDGVSPVALRAASVVRQV